MFVVHHYNERIHVIQQNCMYELCTESLFVLILVLSCAVGCPLSGHYSLGITLFVLLFSLCVQYYSLMSVRRCTPSHNRIYHMNHGYAVYNGHIRPSASDLGVGSYISVIHLVTVIYILCTRVKYFSLVY